MPLQEISRDQWGQIVTLFAELGGQVSAATGRIEGAIHSLDEVSKRVDRLTASVEGQNGNAGLKTRLALLEQAITMVKEMVEEKMHPAGSCPRLKELETEVESIDKGKPGQPSWTSRVEGLEIKEKGRTELWKKAQDKLFFPLLLLFLGGILGTIWLLITHQLHIGP